MKQKKKRLIKTFFKIILYPFKLILKIIIEILDGLN